MIPISNVKVSSTPNGWRICGELRAPPVKLGGQPVALPPVPVCVEVTREQLGEVIADAGAEAGRFWKRVRSWFKR